MIISKVIDEVINLWNQKVGPIFNNIQVNDVELIGNNIGELEYTSIFKDTLVLNINSVAIIKESDNTIEEVRGIKMTVLHELFHALVAIDNNFEFVKNTNFLIYEDEESYVEDAAHHLLTYNVVSNDVKKLIKTYLKQKENLINFFNPYYDYGMCYTDLCVGD